MDQSLETGVALGAGVETRGRGHDLVQEIASTGATKIGSEVVAGTGRDVAEVATATNAVEARRGIDEAEAVKDTADPGLDPGRGMKEDRLVGPLRDLVPELSDDSVGIHHQQN